MVENDLSWGRHSRHRRHLGKAFCQNDLQGALFGSMCNLAQCVPLTIQDDYHGEKALVLNKKPSYQLLIMT